MFDYRALFEIQLQVSVDFLRVVQFETLRREIKVDVRKQQDLYVNNLVGDVKANLRDFYQ